MAEASEVALFSFFSYRRSCVALSIDDRHRFHNNKTAAFRKCTVLRSSAHISGAKASTLAGDTPPSEIQEWWRFANRRFANRSPQGEVPSSVLKAPSGVLWDGHV
jgi:hypothetical protein